MNSWSTIIYCGGDFMPQAFLSALAPAPAARSSKSSKFCGRRGPAKTVDARPQAVEKYYGLAHEISAPRSQE